MLLEVCVDNFASAKEAALGGADRLEGFLKILFTPNILII
jgi:copper homeostasis protein CutC